MKRGNIGRILMKNLQLMALTLLMMTGTATAGTYHVLSDHLGTPQVIIDKNENVVWKADYEPFGKANITTETITNNIRFPGQYYDEETGLHYNYYRYYDPSSGRFITSDPISLYGGLNTYGYANQNPLFFIDSDGLAAVGHHFVPKQVFKNLDLPAEAFDIFNKTTSGKLPGGHGWSKAHKAYNEAVQQLMESWLKNGNIDPTKMSAKQAEDFLDALSKSNNPAIKNFIKEIEKQAGKKLLKKGGGFICRKIPVVAIGFFVYDYTQGGFAHAANELTWPASAIWNDGSQEQCECQ